MTHNATLPLFFDPRQGMTPDAVRELATLHLLLFERVAVQDNFLISELLAKAAARGGQNAIRDWIERGWLTIALREGVHSLGHLKQQLLRQALARTYAPFEERDRGIQLYRSRPFSTYVSELDTALPYKGFALPWSAASLGVRLRDRLRSSAEDGTAGLPPERALEIWHEIDAKSTESTHSRTHYFEYANRLTDPEETKRVRSWVSRLYLTNLPDALKLEISAPRHTLHSVEARDPFLEVQEAIPSASDTAAIRGRDCALLSSLFLSRLTTKQLAKFRGLPEFRVLQAARDSGDTRLLNKALLEYMRAVGESAPAAVDPAITTLKAHLAVKRALATGGGALGVVVSGPLGQALSILSIFLGITRGTDKALDQAEAGARGAAAADPLRSAALHLADFSHEDDAGEHGAGNA